MLNPTKRIRLYLHYNLHFLLSRKVKASPKKLFDTLCFIAGTHSVIESRDVAVQQVKQFDSQLISVLNIIKKLEKDIENEEKLIELINKKDKLLVSKKDAKRGTEQTENAYNLANKYASLLKAVILAKEIEKDCIEEKMLSIDLLRYQSMNQNSIEGKYRKGRIFNFNENTREDEDFNEVHTDSNKGANLYTSVEEYQKSFYQANEIIVQMHHIIKKEKNLLLQLQQEELDHKNSKEEAVMKLIDSETRIKLTENECSSLSKVMRKLLL